MRLLLIILLAFSLQLTAQSPVQFQGGGPDQSSPLILTGPDTFLLSIDSLYGFNYDLKSPDFYDESLGKINWSSTGEAFSIRIGGNFKIPDDCPFTKFAFYTSVGNNINFTRLGSDYSVAYHRGWEQLNEQNIVGGGDSILTDSAGMLFLVVETGTIELANLNLLVQRTEGNYKEPQFVAMSFTSDLPLASAATLANPIDIVFSSNDRVDSDWTVDVSGSTLTYSGSPSYVDLSFNSKMFIPGGANVQRPNYVARIIRINDNKIMAEAATGYIRDTADHEESSWNMSTVDYDPPDNPSYKVVYYRETTTTGLVTLDSESASFIVVAHH